jgi:hypothetical protein
MLRAAGMFLVALGCIWVLQGLGILAWPEDSFMLGDNAWALRGIATAGAGIALIVFVQRRRRS